MVGLHTKMGEFENIIWSIPPDLEIRAGDK